MRICVGIDVAKEEHWATAITDLGEVLLDRRVLNTPSKVVELLSDLEALAGERTVGVDVLGGITSLLCAMLVEAGERVVHVPGLAVNRGREGTLGSENKGDPRDARVIADHVRTRPELRAVEPEDDASVKSSSPLLFHSPAAKSDERLHRRMLFRLLKTHPEIEQRIKILRAMVPNTAPRVVPAPSGLRERAPLAVSTVLAAAIVGVIVLGAFPGTYAGTQAAASPPAPTALIGTVNRPVVRVRAGPSTEHQIYGRLRQGEQVLISGRQGEWYRVWWGPLEARRLAWIRGDLLDVEVRAQRGP